VDRKTTIFYKGDSMPAVKTIKVIIIFDHKVNNFVYILAVTNTI